MGEVNKRMLSTDKERYGTIREN